MHTFCWIIDSSHGWLKVPIRIVKAVKFAPSEFSYWHQGQAYLEEDCDGPNFLKVCDKIGLDYYVSSDPEYYDDWIGKEKYPRWPHHFLQEEMKR